MEQEKIVLGITLLTLSLCWLVFIWNSWTWIGTDGYDLPKKDRPGLLRFWFHIAPRYLLGMKTGMEHLTYNSKAARSTTENPYYWLRPEILLEEKSAKRRRRVE